MLSLLVGQMFGWDHSSNTTLGGAAATQTWRPASITPAGFAPAGFTPAAPAQLQPKAGKLGGKRGGRQVGETLLANVR